jgi:SAM-dependent methyltransferase
MRALREIRGLKFPDDYVVRHAFKQGLTARTGRVLELGCGPGNNLALYQEYGWALTGVDYAADALADARWNLGPAATLVQADLSRGLPALDGRFDALLIPNLLCYLRRAEAETVLRQARGLLAPKADVFLRTRALDDHRCGRGAEVEPRAWRLDTPETGEAGLLNRFYDSPELVGLLTEALGLTEVVTLAVRFENLQNGRLIGNSDLVVWGRVP